MKRDSWIIILVLAIGIVVLAVIYAQKDKSQPQLSEAPPAQVVQYDKESAVWDLVERHDDLFEQYYRAGQEGRTKDREEAQLKMYPVLFSLRSWNMALSENERLAFYNAPTTHERLYFTIINKSEGGAKAPGFLIAQICYQISQAKKAAQKEIASALDDQAAHNIEFRLTAQALRQSFEAWAFNESYCASMLTEEFKVLKPEDANKIIAQEWNYLKQNGLVP